MKKLTLQAENRTIFGRKVKQLRKNGKIPANVFGKKIKSTAITVDGKEFEKVFDEAGNTTVIELSVGGATHPVLVQNMHTHPISRAVLHIDFHEVDLKEKIKAMVPLQFEGESPAVTEKIGVLLTSLDQVEVEALPTHLPDAIIVDVSKLSEVDQVLTVADLKVPGDVTVLTEGEREVVKVGALVTKEAEEDAKAEEEAAAEAAAEAGETEAGSEGAEEKTADATDEKTEESQDKEPDKE